MNGLLPLLSFLVGALGAGIGVWCIMRSHVRTAGTSAQAQTARAESLSEELSTAVARIAGLEVRAEQVTMKEAEVAARDSALEELRTELGDLRAKLASIEATAEAKEAALREQLALLEQAEKKLADTFSSLATEAMRTNREDFLTLAEKQLKGQSDVNVQELEKRRQSIQEMLKPLTTKLSELDLATRKMENEREKAYGELRTELKSVGELQERLRKETGQLVTALRNPVRRGQWGEIQLRRVVEMAGMLERCDFVSQATMDRDEERLRPDIVVSLPNGRTIVVDAKAPLDAFTRAAEAEDDEERRRHYDSHARQVKQHVTQLAAKSYWSALDSTPEFVVMFLPGEPIFSSAVERDPELMEYGVANGVLIATPMTLIALLKSVSQGWRQEQQQENARRIAKTGRELYAALAVFADHYKSVGKNLGQALNAYNNSIGSLERNVLTKGRKLKDYGDFTESDLPEFEPKEATVREICADELRPLGNAAVALDFDMEASQ